MFLPNGCVGLPVLDPRLHVANRVRAEQQPIVSIFGNWQLSPDLVTILSLSVPIYQKSSNFWNV